MRDGNCFFTLCCTSCLVTKIIIIKSGAICRNSSISMHTFSNVLFGKVPWSSMSVECGTWEPGLLKWNWMQLRPSFKFRCSLAVHIQLLGNISGYLSGPLPMIELILLWKVASGASFPFHTLNCVTLQPHILIASCAKRMALSLLLRQYLAHHTCLLT